MKKAVKQSAEGEPLFWDWCDNCGGHIDLGEDYYEDDGQRICTGCARRYAWLDFLVRSTRKTAQTHGPL